MQSGLVHLVLAAHLQLVAAQRSEDLVRRQQAVGRRPGEALDVPQQVGVHFGVELLQPVHVGQVMHLHHVALIQPGEEEVAAEADDHLQLWRHSWRWDARKTGGKTGRRQEVLTCKTAAATRTSCTQSRSSSISDV